MRELNFSRENVAEAFEEIKENFEGELEERMDGNTAEFLNEVLRIEAGQQIGADLCIGSAEVGHGRAFC